MHTVIVKLQGRAGDSRGPLLPYWPRGAYSRIGVGLQNAGDPMRMGDYWGGKMLREGVAFRSGVPTAFRNYPRSVMLHGVGASEPKSPSACFIRDKN